MVGKGFDELFEFEGGRGVVGPGPGEEADGFGGGGGGGAGAEDAEDELGGEGEIEFGEGAFRVDIMADDVGDVVDGGKVIVFGGFEGG